MTTSFWLAENAIGWMPTEDNAYPASPPSCKSSAMTLASDSGSAIQSTPPLPPDTRRTVRQWSPSSDMETAYVVACRPSAHCTRSPPNSRTRPRSSTMRCGPAGACHATAGSPSATTIASCAGTVDTADTGTSGEPSSTGSSSNASESKQIEPRPPTLL